jgi:hypothetical protein
MCGVWLNVYWYRILAFLQLFSIPRRRRLAVSSLPRCFHIWWKTTSISESYGKMLRRTASQLQHFLGLNKDPGRFLHMCQGGSNQPVAR